MPFTSAATNAQLDDGLSAIALLNWVQPAPDLGVWLRTRE
jgi:hypothetical protein